jgi:hypothetical protein
MDDREVDIGPLSGTELLTALVLAIAETGIGRTTRLTSGGRSLALITPVPEPSHG